MPKQAVTGQGISGKNGVAKAAVNEQSLLVSVKKYVVIHDKKCVVKKKFWLSIGLRAVSVHDGG